MREGNAITVFLLPTHLTTQYTSHRTHAVLRSTHNESIHFLVLLTVINRRTTHHHAPISLVRYICNTAALHQHKIRADPHKKNSSMRPSHTYLCCPAKPPHYAATRNPASRKRLPMQQTQNMPHAAKHITALQCATAQTYHLPGTSPQPKLPSALLALLPHKPTTYCLNPIPPWSSYRHLTSPPTNEKHSTCLHITLPHNHKRLSTQYQMQKTPRTQQEPIASSLFNQRRSPH